MRLTGSAPNSPSLVHLPSKSRWISWRLLTGTKHHHSAVAISIDLWNAKVEPYICVFKLGTKGNAFAQMLDSWLFYFISIQTLWNGTNPVTNSTKVDIKYLIDSNQGFKFDHILQRIRACYTRQLDLADMKNRLSDKVDECFILCGKDWSPKFWRGVRKRDSQNQTVMK